MDELAYHLHPRRRLDTLFLVHSTASIVIGIFGFVFPSSFGAVFLWENDREFYVLRALIRPCCALILAQGLIIYRSRKINDGQIKRAFVQAYFICFLMCTIALIGEHVSNTGVLSGKFMGTMKIISMVFLTVGYAWFTFFQPPSVFQGLAMRHAP
eukprot:CAMPEP_0116127636 /NCGR_PEP_ID=MMETSP0329-20121206/6941_1 /TAXON_ID=697910 /ORGANISM="Pseudo-nitzschia arenysensis, Strain B593" /LENGTH=154 /DNA_ID=CAMNT_0003621739 /DNA_START=63 /DNA_END=527 /DNA_ORIENTATION=+